MDRHMKNQNNFSNSFAYKLRLSIGKRFGLILTLLICLIALLPSNSFAQPLAQGMDKFLGCSTSSYIWRYLGNYWNQITPGNDGKWESVESTQGQYNWTNLDKIYNFAKNRNILFKEHVFVWGNQQPSWIASLDSAGQRAAVENWIKVFSERYTLMTLVDVVNEPFHTPLPTYKNALGGDGQTGWDWVITAFEMARKYCPSGAKLILNEYNVLHDNTVTTNYLTIINLLKDRGLIDGIGIQGHYFEFRSHMDATSNKYTYSTESIKSNLNKLAATGLPIYITEFDIDESNDANQLAQYKIYFPIFWNHPGVKGITFWGYIQDDVWSSHPDTYLILADGTERPALQWLRNYILLPTPPELVSPVSTTGEQYNPLLVWRSSSTATSYRVQLSSSRAFATTIIDTTVTDTTLQLDSLAANTTYFWRVNAINNKGEGDYSAFSSFVTADLVAVEEYEKVSRKFDLLQNYPNPFNPTTTISFNLPQRSSVRLVLMDILGREVINIDKGSVEAGAHKIELNASGLTSGVYIYRLEAGNFISSKKLILMK
jgi:endo-1,4-beta-xylanase